MNATSVIQSVKDRAVGARSTIEVIAAHSPAVIQSGTKTLRAAKEVVANAKREARVLAMRTKDDLKLTMKEGAAEIGDRLLRLATATREDLAEARKEKAEVNEHGQRAQRLDDGTQQMQASNGTDEDADDAMPKAGYSDSAT